MSSTHLFRALSSGQCVVALSEVKMLSPVTAPEKVVCVGMNYRDHCLEQNAPIPKEPIIFSKFPSAITGPYDDIVLPEESQVSLISVTLSNQHDKRQHSWMPPGMLTDLDKQDPILTDRPREQSFKKKSLFKVIVWSIPIATIALFKLTKCCRKEE